MPKRYSPKLKFQVVMELLQSEKTVGQVAKAYGVHPNSANKWKKTFLENAYTLLPRNGVRFLVCCHCEPLHLG